MMIRILDTLTFSMPYVCGFLPLLFILTFTTGCTSTSGDSAGTSRNFATTAVTTATGAYIGAKEGDGSPRSAAVGAAVGFVTGEAVNFLNDKAQRDAFLAGYEKGQSNAVKQQYWLARDNQRPSTDDGYEEAYYEIPVPQNDREGVRREATKRVIRIVVPKEEGKS